MSVYFIRVGRYFKIGATRNAERRFERIHASGTRYTFPADASLALTDRELYRVIDGWKDRETHIHNALCDFYVGLEWFLDEPPLRSFIDALPEHEPNRMRALRKVERPGGDARHEWDLVDHGRAEREMARFNAKRVSA